MIDNSVSPDHEYETNINSYALYNTYAASKNKPFILSETGSPLHPEQPVGPGELAIKQAWWRQSITSADILTRYPQIKMVCQFEFSKYEGPSGNDLRDFRISTNLDILDEFKKDFAGVQHLYAMANYTAPPAGFIVTPDGLVDPSRTSSTLAPTSTSTTGTTPGTVIKGPSTVTFNSSASSIATTFSILLFMALTFCQL
jgi:hypothetical protein